jgi:hypothetical protein
MLVRFLRRFACWALFASLSPAAGIATSAHAEECNPRCPPAPCDTLWINPAPLSTPGQAPAPMPSASTLAEPSSAPTFDVASRQAGGGQSFSAAGYIDNAIPVTQFRLRFDAAYGDNRPDRAEFFYAKCSCLTALTPQQAAALGTNNRAAGPTNPTGETNVDFQDVAAYVEVAVNNRLSGFVEMPYRFLNPELNDNANGIADMNFGLKYAFIASREQYLTFQFRTFLPTGDSHEGLGTDHVSLEPAFLWQRQFGERLTGYAEVRDWIPVNGSDFAGNVVRYGVGASYLVYDAPKVRVSPVAELVGWTVLGGKELTNTEAVVGASGDTIINAKIGVRAGFGCQDDTGWLSRSDLYIGYGRALTGDVWYKDIIRAEFRVRF